MTSIRTTVHNRRIDVPVPDDLPDGTEVEVQLVPVGEPIGREESEWDDSPEGIAAWLREYEVLEPLVFTPEDLAELDADRQQRKAWEKSQFDYHAEKLAKRWE